VPFIESVKEFLGTDTFLAGGGVATGFIVGDLAGNAVASKLGYEGDKALAVSAITKVATGAGLYAVGMSVRSATLRSFLRFAGIGAVASMILDIIDRIFPAATASSAALKARLKGRNIRRATPPTRVIRAPQSARPTPVQVEVAKETPAAEAKPALQFM